MPQERTVHALVDSFCNEQYFITLWAQDEVRQIATIM
ncbi:hypothetical protein FHR98_000191 [Limibacillus halophilus]|uniref:Uncharacterized protein n=1 Tax=Limibacillus halophilus TaxID=1579333 RepID=A0A839SRD6_9PROT|nr:hypothetical protein [Limibacillus halophilus]